MEKTRLNKHDFRCFITIMMLYSILKNRQKVSQGEAMVKQIFVASPGQPYRYHSRFGEAKVKPSKVSEK